MILTALPVLSLIGLEELIVLCCHRLIFCHWPRCLGQPLTPADNVAYPITCRMRPYNPTGDLIMTEEENVFAVVTSDVNGVDLDMKASLD